MSDINVWRKHVHEISKIRFLSPSMAVGALQEFSSNFLQFTQQLAMLL